MRVILLLFFISTSSRETAQLRLVLTWCDKSSIYSSGSSSCAIITPAIYTLHSSLYTNSSHWLAHLQSKQRNWLLKSCAIVIGGYVLYATHTAHYMVYVHVLLFWCIILSFCINTSHTATGVMKIEVHRAVSETPYFCLIVHLYTCVFVCACLSLLYVCYGRNKTAGKIQIKQKQGNRAETKQRGERESECQSVPI